MPKPHLRIHLDIEPVACPRPCVTQRGIVYYPKRYKQFKKTAVGMLATVDVEPLKGPVDLSATFVFAIPKSWPKWKKAQYAGTSHTQKPDLDNLIKSIKDVLTGVAYEDDRQVARLGGCEKLWSRSGKGRIEIGVREIDALSFRRGIMQS